MYIVEVFIIYTYAADIFEKKYKTAGSLVLGCCLFTIPFVINIMWNNIVLNSIVFASATTIFIFLAFKAQFAQSLLHGVIVSLIMFATEIFCLYLISFVANKGSFYAYRDSLTVYFLDAITSKIVFLFIAKLFSRFTKKDKTKIYKLPIPYFLYTLTSTSMIFILILVNLQYKFSNGLEIAMMVISTLLLLSLVFIFISYENAAVKNAEIIELKSEKQKQEIDQKYYQILDAQNEKMKTFVHDTKHHLAAILNLAQNPEITNYINSINSDLKKYSSECCTNNKSLDIIVNQYNSLCKSEKINFETDIRTSNLSFIEPAKLTSLLSNILDNAVEAAIKCDEPKVYLSINKNENFHVLNCVNSCKEKPLFENNIMKTTKNDKQLHGFGTKSIAKIVEFYSGTFRYDYNEEAGDFSITVLFPEL